MSIEVGDMPMTTLKKHMERTFRQLAADKNLDFNVQFDEELPTTIRTDEKRLQQVVLNLLSNAFKFTAHGSVTLAVRSATGGWSKNHPVLRGADSAIEIAVTDTGIGIPEDKQKLIFEAFQQADGTTSRKYGGTGLGLSISREIARLLGGELQVRSTPGEGSTFTLFVPLQTVAPAITVTTATARYENSGALVPAALPGRISVRRRSRCAGRQPAGADRRGRYRLCVDPARSGTRGRPQGRRLDGRRGHAGDGAQAPARCDHARPGLSDIDGFVLLDLLKHDLQTNHLPIHVISGADKVASVLDMGAFGVTAKPADRETLTALFAGLAETIETRRRTKKNGKVEPIRPDRGLELVRTAPELAGAKVLIVDDDIRNIYSLTSVLESYGVEVLHAERGRDGIVILEQTPDIAVALIDIMMPEMDGYETMQQIRQRPALADVPLISVTAKAMKGDRQKCLDAGVRTISPSRSTSSCCWRCCACGSAARAKAVRWKARRRGQ